MSEFKHSITLRESITHRIDQFDRIEQPYENLTRAAVVLAVSKQGNNACLLLTKRSSALRKHAGQYALPGGKLDAGETITEAALRELSEELNLQPDSRNIIGTLDDITTHSGFCITPVVVWVDDHTNIKPNPDEVAKVFEIPLDELAAADLGSENEDNQTVMSIYLPTVGTSVYSPTAALIYQFKEVVLCGRSTRVAHFGQPKFAWK